MSPERKGLLQLAVAVLVVVALIAGVAIVAPYLWLYFGLSLHDAAYGGNTVVVQEWLDHGADVDARARESNSTPLHMAAANGAASTVDLLIRRGADISAKDTNGNTPFDLAARFPHRGVMKRLQEAGAPYTLRAALYLGDVDAVKRAAAERPEEVRDLLKVEGYPRDAMDRLERSPEMLAVLLEHGLDPNVFAPLPPPSPGRAPTFRPCSLLYRYAEANDAATTALLLAHGARFTPDSGEPDTIVVGLNPGLGRDPAYVAARREIVRLLREGDALADSLNVAVFLGDLEGVKRVAEQHPEEVRTYLAGSKHLVMWTTYPLFRMSFLAGSPEMLLLLLDHGLDPNVPVEIQMNARENESLRHSLLHQYAWNGDVPVVKALLEHGARLTADGQEKEPLVKRLRQVGYKEVLDLLRQHGALPAAD